MKLTPVQREQAALRLPEVESLIHATVFKFQRTYGGDIDDLLSTSYKGYLSAVRRYDEKGKFSFKSWVYYEIWTCMFNDFLKRQYEQKRQKIFYEQTREDFTHITRPLADFVDELSGDARTIVNLILSTPDDLQQLIEQSGGGIKKVKECVYKYLRNIGWQGKRIQLSYAEIQKALG